MVGPQFLRRRPVRFQPLRPRAILDSRGYRAHVPQRELPRRSLDGQLRRVRGTGPALSLSNARGTRGRDFVSRADAGYAGARRAAFFKQGGSSECAADGGGESALLPGPRQRRIRTERVPQRRAASQGAAAGAAWRASEYARSLCGAGKFDTRKSAAPIRRRMAALRRHRQREHVSQWIHIGTGAERVAPLRPTTGRESLEQCRAIGISHDYSAALHTFETSLQPASATAVQRADAGLPRARDDAAQRFSTFRRSLSRSAVSSATVQRAAV